MWGVSRNLAAMLCYSLGPISAVPFLFLVEPYRADALVRFHAWQSIAVSLLLVLTNTVVTAWAPQAAPHAGLASLILWVALLLLTYEGRKVSLPVIGAWAETMANSNSKEN